MTFRAGAALRLAALVLLLVVAWVLLGRALTAAQLLTLFRTAWWGPPLFVLLYATATALALPGLVLTLVGGAAYGFGWGSALNLLGANLGATTAFWLARALGRAGVQSLVGARLTAVDRVSTQQGFGWLLRLRLIPVVPFNLLNFACGLTAMPWRTFAAATLIGIVPGTLAYTYFAAALLSAGTAHTQAQTVITRLALALVALVAVSLLPAVARRAGWIDSP